MDRNLIQLLDREIFMGFLFSYGYEFNTILYHVLVFVDMHAMYMKSVRSPPVPGPGSRFKMAHRHSPDIDVFSQVPLQDATYMEDSFVVQGEEEEEDQEMREGISLVAMDNTINLDNIIDEGSRRTGGRRLRSRVGESKAARILRAGRAAVLKSDSSHSDVEEAAEDDDLMDWEIDLNFEDCRKNQRKNHSNHQALGKGTQLGDHRRLVKGIVSSKPSSDDWISKPTTDTQPFKVNHKDAHAVKEKVKSPLKTNYALMNSERIKEGYVDPDKGVSKPCTFIPPRPAAPSNGSLVDSPQTLAQREKEERLRRQKQKQADFLQKLQQKRAQTSSQAAANIGPHQRTLSLSSWSRKKEEGMGKMTTTNHTLSRASPGSNTRCALPNSEGFKVTGLSGEDSLSMKSDTASKGASTTFTNRNIDSRRDRCTPVVSASNKINHNLTMMDNTVANTTMSTTAVNSSALNSPRVSIYDFKVTL